MITFLVKRKWALLGLKFESSSLLRPLKRLLDDITDEAETGHPGLNSWWNMMMKLRAHGLRLAVVALHGRQLGRRWRSSISSLRHINTTPSSHPLLSASFNKNRQQSFFNRVRHNTTKTCRLYQGCPISKRNYSTPWFSTGHALLESCAFCEIARD
jgi:hypothetical protein